MRDKLHLPFRREHRWVNKLCKGYVFNHMFQSIFCGPITRWCVLQRIPVYVLGCGRTTSSNALMKMGGMIQYGRVDLDLAAYDVKYFLFSIGFGLFNNSNLKLFPRALNQIRFTLSFNVWQVSGAFFLCQIFSTPTASMVRSFPSWKCFIFAKGKIGTVKRFIYARYENRFSLIGVKCIVLCGE